jgi:hypothetical protein
LKSTLEIIEAIEDFLEVRELSVNNGFALVSKEDFAALVEIIDALVEAKWAPDPDGDYPIETLVINRNNHERLPYRAVAYRHIDKKQYQRDIVTNLSTALGDMILSQDLDEIEERNEQ